MVVDPDGFLDEWQTLYAQLVRRHGIRGIAVFSGPSFARQFRVRGFSALRATVAGVTIGATLWYEYGSVAYYHLGAYSERGYDLGASFALFAFARDHFAAGGSSGCPSGRAPALAGRASTG